MLAFWSYAFPQNAVLNHAKHPTLIQFQHPQHLFSLSGLQSLTGQRVVTWPGSAILKCVEVKSKNIKKKLQESNPLHDMMQGIIYIACFVMAWCCFVALDERFILKQMTRYEVQSFCDFALDYFQYVTTAHSENVRTAFLVGRFLVPARRRMFWCSDVFCVVPEADGAREDPRRL